MAGTPPRYLGRARRLAAAVVAAALVASGTAGAPSAARAEASSDIPGIPLPGPIVTGILGGPVYDVVYRLDLAPGSVIVASLTGSPGTDFDIYLFDASATTVVNNVGVVARSTGPTSTESLAYATASGGRFYLDLNGATDLAGAYTLTVQTAIDGTPPALVITLEGGRPSINRSTVTVALDATDDLARVAEMAFSTDGLAFGPWQAYAATATVELPAGDGPRSAWARVRNAVGLESAPATASIVVDTRAPAVVGVQPAPGSHVSSLRPLIRVAFDEPIAPSSWVANGLLVQRADGVRVSGRSAVDAGGQGATFTPDEDLPAGSACLLTLGPVTDLAGNTVLPVPSWTILPLAFAAITARAGASPVTRGTAVTIAGTYRGSTPAPPLTLASRVGSDGDVWASRRGSGGRRRELPGDRSSLGHHHLSAGRPGDVDGRGRGGGRCRRRAARPPAAGRRRGNGRGRLRERDLAGRPEGGPRRCGRAGRARADGQLPSLPMVGRCQVVGADLHPGREDRGCRHCGHGLDAHEPGPVSLARDGQRDSGVLHRLQRLGDLDRHPLRRGGGSRAAGRPCACVTGGGGAALATSAARADHDAA